jgi:hypothetical protein
VIAIETTGLAETIARLKNTSKKLTNLEPAYKRFAAEMVKKTDDSFQDSKGYDGEAWDELADSTIEHRWSNMAGRKKTDVSRAELTRRAHAAAAQSGKPVGDYLNDIEKILKRQAKQKAKRKENAKKKVAVRQFGQRLAGETVTAAFKPLIDTARARNSNHATTSHDGIEWSAVGYLGYSMSGTVRMPMRNPSPFYWDGSAWKLRESAMKSLGTHLRNHIYGSST